MVHNVENKSGIIQFEGSVLWSKHWGWKLQADVKIAKQIIGIENETNKLVGENEIDVGGKFEPVP